MKRIILFPTLCLMAIMSCTKEAETETKTEKEIPENVILDKHEATIYPEESVTIMASGLQNGHTYLWRYKYNEKTTESSITGAAVLNFKTESYLHRINGGTVTIEIQVNKNGIYQTLDKCTVVIKPTYTNRGQITTHYIWSYWRSCYQTLYTYKDEPDTYYFYSSGDMVRVIENKIYSLTCTVPTDEAYYQYMCEADHTYYFNL